MPADLSRPLILVLEDDAAAAAALMTLLDDWGYDAARSAGLSGLDDALGGRAAQVRAVISDYHLADGAAPEAVAGLRARGVDVPVLMMTGTLRGRARADARAGHHDFLEKPAAAGDILAWLKRAVGA